MLSPADMLILGVAALMFFGPDQLPKVARRAGKVVRDVQATSQSFIREMEHAADDPEPPKHDWSAMHVDYNTSPPTAPHYVEAENGTATLPATHDLEAPKHADSATAARYSDWAQTEHDPDPGPPPRHMAPDDPIAGPAPKSPDRP